MLKSFSLALKFLRRELRVGEWFIIFFALFLTVTAVTGLHFYTDRLQRGIDELSIKLLGGDLVVSSPAPFPDSWLHQAKQQAIRTSQVWIYPSVVNANNKMQLVNIQAVDQNYPLTSERLLSLPPQTVLVDSRLLPILNAKLNDTITIGAANFNMQQLLPSDMDMVNTGWVIAPRVLMHLAEVPATKTVLPGSRVEYRLLLVGNKNQINAFRQWITPQLKPGQSLIDINNQRFPIRDTLNRADNYIQLVLLVCLLMSGVVIALSIRQYLIRHYDYVALWRCLGALENQIKFIFIWQLILIALAAGLLGIFTGYALQEIIAHLLNPFLRIPLAQPSLNPILLGFVTSLFLLFAYAYPVITELPRTSPLFIWRNEIVISATRSYYLLITLGLLLIYVYWALDFSLLVLFFIDALLLSIGFLYIINIILLAGLRKLTLKTEGTVRRGLSQLIQHPDSTSMQLTAFVLILMALLLLNLVRDNLLSRWQQTLPANTPNYFAINIAPNDVPSLKDFFQRHHINIEQLYPIVRGRIIELNNIPIMEAVPPSARSHNALHRELNLSWMVEYPSDNQVVAGTKWDTTATGQAFASVEKNLAQEMQLKLGDKLTFQVADRKFQTTITNFRSLDWSSFHPNFFFIFPPGLIEEFPATYITSFHLQPEQTILLNQIVQQFPNITVIDVASVLLQIQNIIEKISLAIEYLFYFAAGLGVLIFITSLQASMDERRETYALLRVLGASRNYITKSLLVEFLCLAILVVILGYLLAKVIAYLLVQVIFP